MIRLRTKIYFVICGIQLGFATIGAMAGALKVLLIGFGFSFWAWMVANALLEEDAEELMKKMEGRE